MATRTFVAKQDIHPATGQEARIEVDWNDATNLATAVRCVNPTPSRYYARASRVTLVNDVRTRDRAIDFTFPANIPAGMSFVIPTGQQQRIEVTPIGDGARLDGISIDAQFLDL